MKDVLVFFSFRNHKTGYYSTMFDPLHNVQGDYGLRLFQGSLKDLHIEVKDNELFVTESSTGRSLDSFDVVDLEMWLKAPQQALAATTYLDRHNIPMTTREPLGVLCDTKVSEIVTMSGNRIPLPHTFTSSSREIKKIFKHTPKFKYPFIAKAADTFGGKMNYLVKSYAELVQALDTNPEQTFILQEFIPNDCDYRVLVMGGKVRLVMRRFRDKNTETHLNNTSAGADSEFLPVETLSLDMQGSVLAAANVTGRSGFAGVDLIVDKKTGKHYILEVNDQPAIQVGSSPEVKIPAYMNYIKELAYGDSNQ
jgi:glutathione synthase/RimK-type ligase-like ATP-grasp enzyme